MDDGENKDGIEPRRRQAINEQETTSVRADECQCIRQDQIALKYLEMARAEILDRMKQSNQTLIVYLAGISAIVGWVYQLTKAHEVQPSVVVFPVGAVIAFLSFAASWIMFHNERMVNALARYQKQGLAPYLKLAAPRIDPWECSVALHNTDSVSTTAMTMLVQGILIVGPNLGSVAGMLWLSHRPWPIFQRSCFAIVLVLTLSAFALSFAMIFHRRALRKEVGA